MKRTIKKIFWYPFNSKDRIEELQERIRLKEWQSFEKFIPENCTFLDVGCGAGHNLQLARNEKRCIVKGVDAEPGSHGVGRFSKQLENNSIQQAFAEDLPFNDKEFDVVFCSHVLEHVNDEAKSLQEINRVLKDKGVAIIGMPTATMAWVHLFSHYFLATHRNVLFAFKAVGKKDFWKRIMFIFVPGSHSAPRAKTIFYDLNHYRVANWKKIVSNEFIITETQLPLLYPYPDYIQWFKMKSSKRFSSSVFFICKKKHSPNHKKNEKNKSNFLF